MSQDLISDTLNRMMNAKRAGKIVLVVDSYSKLLLNILEIMKSKDYIDFEINSGKLKITLKDLSECRTIKPRYTLKRTEIEKYIRRFLPSRNLGYVLVSTNKGLMIHQDAMENKLGGSLIAYFY